MKPNILAACAVALFMFNFSSALADQEQIQAEFVERTPEQKNASEKIRQKMDPFLGTFALVPSASTDSNYCYNEILIFPDYLGNDKSGKPLYVIRIQATMRDRDDSNREQTILADSFSAHNEKTETLSRDKQKNGGFGPDSHNAKTDYSLFTETKFSAGTKEVVQLDKFPWISFSFKNETNLERIKNNRLVYSKTSTSYGIVTAEFECVYSKTRLPIQINPMFSNLKLSEHRW